MGESKSIISRKKIRVSDMSECIKRFIFLRIRDKLLMGHKKLREQKYHTTNNSGVKEVLRKYQSSTLGQWEGGDARRPRRRVVVIRYL